jgi:hypothetical protein
VDRVPGDIDESQFTELCGSFYEAAQTPVLMTQALDRTREIFGFEAFHQFVIDTQTGMPLKEWANQRITADDMAQYAQYYYVKDPRPVLASKLGVGRLFNTRNLYDKHSESHSEIMQDFLHPRGVGHCLGGQLMASESLIGYTAFLDAKDRVAKTPKQLAYLTRLIPHLSKSTTLMMELDSLRGRLAANENALDQSETAILTLSGRHRVVSANRKAESLLRRQTLLRLTQGCLSIHDPNALNRWLGLLGRVRSTGVSESMTLFGERAESHLQVSVSRIFSKSNDALTGGADLLVMISSVDHRRVASVKQLTALFGLSHAEALLARALAQGMETGAFAESRGIKMTTVRTQTQSILEKLQIKRMPDLIRVVLSVPAARS